MNDLKRQYILADHCDGCGVVPYMAGHSCSRAGVEEKCPLCGKLLFLMQSGGKVLFRADGRCRCLESCPLCQECCKLLEASALA